jgi:pimeloyl-ACP methyl ester carboxylesterase
MTSTSSPLAVSRAIAGAAGAPVWVEQRGSGTPVLLLGGLGDAHDAWGFQLEGGLAARHRLIAPDNRGVGRSPVPDDGISITGMADDAAAVLRELGVGPALALRHPELVRSLALVNTYGWVDPHTERLLRTWIALAEHAPPEVFLGTLLHWVYSDAAHADGRVAAWLAEAFEHPHPQSGEALIATARACLAHDVAARLSEIAAPALVVAGEADPIFDPAHQRTLAASIPGARLEFMPGLAHQPFQEDPAAFDALVASFWQGVEEAGR